jgi:acyl carrier protein
MTPEEMRKAIVEALAQVAPDTQPARIGIDEDIRDALDIDSVDFLNFILVLHKRLGVDVPEADYAKLATIHKAANYLIGAMA